MKCPICETESGNESKCPICGFDQLDIELLNRDEADAWIENVVKPLREKYHNRIKNITNDEYEIENGVLKKYKGNASDVVIPYGITCIGRGAFSRCKNLVSIILPDSVTYIGVGAFYDCASLNSIKIPDGVTTIEYLTFSDCKNLTSVILPNSLTDICGEAFCCCENLTTINLPDGLKCIGDCAFMGCKNLTSVSVLGSDTFIADSAFSSCDKITLSLHRNSYAEEYARKHKIDYEVIDSFGNYEFLDIIKPETKVMHIHFGIGVITEVCTIAEKQEKHGAECGIDDRNILVEENETDNLYRAKITVRFADGTERKFAHPMAFKRGFLSLI